MKYLDGQTVHVGDRVSLEGGMSGDVVAVIDTGSYAAGFVESEWEYLGKGLLVRSFEAGLIHYPELDEEIELVARAGEIR